MNKFSNETAQNARSYKPSQDYPFNLDPMPDAFSLGMVEQYSSFPSGIFELTSEGVVPLQKEATSLYAEFGRVYVIRQRLGGSALIELTEEALCLEAAEEYLSAYGSHIQGIHIREYGRLGAAIINACLAFQSQHSMEAGDEEENPIFSGRVLPRCTFERGIRRIEVDSVPLRADTLVRTDQEMRDWKAWLRLKSSTASMVVKGHIPAGVSFYGEQVFELAQARKKQLVPASGRPVFTSRNQIVGVTAPNGTLCLMCLDMLGAMRSAMHMDSSAIMNWLQDRVPEEVFRQYDLQCVLYAEIAERVVAHHRYGETLGLPVVTSTDGVRHPILLDYVVIEPTFNASQIYAPSLR